MKPRKTYTQRYGSKDPQSAGLRRLEAYDKAKSEWERSHPGATSEEKRRYLDGLLKMLVPV